MLRQETPQSFDLFVLEFVRSPALLSRLVRVDDFARLRETLHHLARLIVRYDMARLEGFEVAAALEVGLDKGAEGLGERARHSGRLLVDQSTKDYGPRAARLAQMFDSLTLEGYIVALDTSRSVIDHGAVTC